MTDTQNQDDRVSEHGTCLGKVWYTSALSHNHDTVLLATFHPLPKYTLTACTPSLRTQPYATHGELNEATRLEGMRQAGSGDVKAGAISHNGLCFYLTRVHALSLDVGTNTQYHVQYVVEQDTYTSESTFAPHPCS